MKRGEVVIVRMADTQAAKARPCVVVLRDSAAVHADKVTVCPLTSKLRGTKGGRPFVAPDDRNGLLHPSEVQVDWIFTHDISRIGKLAGELDDAVMGEVDIALRHWLAL